LSKLRIIAFFVIGISVNSLAVDAEPVSRSARVIVGKQVGYWAIFASLPGGEDWFYDRMGETAKSKTIYAKTDPIIATLNRCGVVASRDLSDFYSDFTRDLVIVVAGPAQSKKAANTMVARASECGVKGYIKYAVYIPPQPGED
jgi:hypothetical protein